jgi:hypothetical protein
MMFSFSLLLFLKCRETCRTHQPRGHGKNAQDRLSLWLHKATISCAALFFRDAGARSAIRRSKLRKKQGRKKRIQAALMAAATLKM